jgi:formylglycine-generating enzyme required for sulfatase activity
MQTFAPIILVMGALPLHSAYPKRAHHHQKKESDPSAIIQQLKAERDVAARQALILSLGELTDQQLSAAQRRPLVDILLRWYRNDPDPGIHGAIEWLLRNRRQGEKPRKLDWKGADALATIDRALAGKAPGRRGWYVTREGYTMTVLRGPIDFTMGSPADEPGRTVDETRRRMRIPRSFAIAGKEVTIRQFRRFLEANPEIQRTHNYAEDPTRMARVLRTFSPDDDGPQIAVTWYEAAQYCNWLSKEEGLPESEWVYPKLDDIKSGMKMPGDYLHRKGYRLLTEAEWEYAARAGSVTARFFGASDELLSQYAWYSKSPPKRKEDPISPTDPQRTWPVGQLKPNGFGLFDIYGNVWEWLQDRRQEYPPSMIIVQDLEDTVLIVQDSEARTRRGGSFAYGAEVMRSAHRGFTTYFPMQRRDNVGFRIGRTLR